MEEDEDMEIRCRRESIATTEFVLSHAEALLAGTLALMTALVQDGGDARRHAIRQQVIANLAELERHAQLSQQFRAAASHLQWHWHALDTGVTGDPRLWQSPAGMVQ